MGHLYTLAVYNSFAPHCHYWLFSCSSGVPSSTCNCFYFLCPLIRMGTVKLLSHLVYLWYGIPNIVHIDSLSGDKFVGPFCTHYLIPTCDIHCVCYRYLLLCSILLLCVSAGCMVYAMIRHPTLNHNNWHSTAPIHTAAATLTCLAGGIL